MVRRREKDDQAKITHAVATTVESAWDKLSKYYPKAVRDVVDSVNAEGGLTMTDIANMELAEHTTLMLARKALPADAAKAKINLTKMMASNRRHIRLILDIAGQGSKVNVPTAIPEEVLELMDDEDIVDIEFDLIN